MNIMKEIKFVPPTIETFNEGSPGVIKPEPVFIPASPATAAAPETDPHCQVHYYLMGDGHCTCSPAAPAETPRCQFKDCPAPTDRYDNVHIGYAWNWQGHPVPSTRNKHAWQPAERTEPRPYLGAEGEETLRQLRKKPSAQPGEDARRVAKIIDEEVPVDMFDNSDEGAEKYRRQVAEVIQSSIDSATRELKAELDKTTKERDDLLKSYDLDDKAAWALNKGLAEADEKTDKLESEVSQLKAESAKKDFALDQADKNLKLLYSEVSRLTAELAALRVSHGKLLKTATGITDCLRDLKLLPARDASTQSTPAATQGKEKTE